MLIHVPSAARSDIPSIVILVTRTTLSIDRAGINDKRQPSITASGNSTTQHQITHRTNDATNIAITLGRQHIKTWRHHQQYSQAYKRKCGRGVYRWRSGSRMRIAGASMKWIRIWYVGSSTLLFRRKSEISGFLYQNHVV